MVDFESSEFDKGETAEFVGVGTCWKSSLHIFLGETNTRVKARVARKEAMTELTDEWQRRRIAGKPPLGQHPSVSSGECMLEPQTRHARNPNP